MKTTPKLTPWFTNGEKPAYIGVYNVSCRKENQTGKYYSYWDGKQFNKFAFYVSDAYDKKYSNYEGIDCVLTEGSWRGLAEKSED